MDRQPAREDAFRFSPHPNRAKEIEWQEWGNEPFHAAEVQDKLVLLAISAVWCHWCHVMDETTYSDSEVIATINRDFVAVRVDTDRQPDVNARYNQGGWPTTALLTPDGDLLWGATYLTPEQMRSALIQVKNFYRANRSNIQQHIPVATPQPREMLSSKELNAASSAQIVDALRDHFDPVHGGFGTQPKFPHLDALRFAVERYFHTGDSGLANIVRLSLTAMQNGEICDHVAGGFFRYATMRNWSTPHFEKMLLDNAGFLRLYSEADRVFGEHSYRDTAFKVAGYLLNTLHDSERGCFFGSQDADEDYYALDQAGRVQRVAPYIDRTIYVDWNAEVASSFALAHRVFGDAGFRQVSLRTVDFLWQNCYRPDVGMSHYWDGLPGKTGLLSDQVATLEALLDVHEISGNPAYLQQAVDLARVIRDSFAADSGGFYDLAGKDGGRVGLLRLPHRDQRDNSRLAEAFRRLGIMIGDGRWRELACTTISAFAAEGPQQGLFAGLFGLAVDRILGPTTHIVVVGERQDARTADLFWEAVRLFEPNKVAQLVEPGNSLLSVLGYPATPSPVVYVCTDRTCSPPITDPSKIERAVVGR